MTGADVTVFVVDDDVAVRKSLKRLIESVGYKVETFASAREYLEQDPCAGPACLVLDVRMPEMSGLDLQDKLTSYGLSITVVTPARATRPPAAQ